MLEATTVPPSGGHSLACKWKYQCLADLFNWFGFDQTGKRVGRGGGGGGQVVSVLTFHSDDPSSNPAEAYSFFL